LQNYGCFGGGAQNLQWPLTAKLLMGSEKFWGATMAWTSSITVEIERHTSVSGDNVCCLFLCHAFNRWTGRFAA